MDNRNFLLGRGERLAENVVVRWVRRHKRIESYIGIEHVFVSWPVWSARSIQSTF